MFEPYAKYNISVRRLCFSKSAFVRDFRRR